MINDTELDRIAFICQAHLEGPEGNPETADLNYDQLGLVNLCSTFLILYRGVLPVQGTDEAQHLQAGIDAATLTMRQYIQDGVDIDNTDDDERSTWNIVYGIMTLYRKHIEAGKILLGPRKVGV